MEVKTQKKVMDHLFRLVFTRSEFEVQLAHDTSVTGILQKFLFDPSEGHAPQIELASDYSIRRWEHSYKLVKKLSELMNLRGIDENIYFPCDVLNKLEQEGFVVPLNPYKDLEGDARWGVLDSMQPLAVFKLSHSKFEELFKGSVWSPQDFLRDTKISNIALPLKKWYDNDASSLRLRRLSPRTFYHMISKPGDFVFDYRCIRPSDRLQQERSQRISKRKVDIGEKALSKARAYVRDNIEEFMGLKLGRDFRNSYELPQCMLEGSSGSWTPYSREKQIEKLGQHIEMLDRNIRMMQEAMRNAKDLHSIYGSYANPVDFENDLAKPFLSKIRMNFAAYLLSKDEGIKEIAQLCAQGG